VSAQGYLAACSDGVRRKPRLEAPFLDHLQQPFLVADFLGQQKPALHRQLGAVLHQGSLQHLEALLELGRH
jgi:hypothetical protein